MNTKIVCLSLLSTLLVACASFTSQAQAQKNQSVLESLYGISLSGNRIELKVKSNGCTSQEDFRLDLKLTGTQGQLSVIRIEQDRCRRMPKIVTIEKTLDDSVLEPNVSIILINPLKASHK